METTKKITIGKNSYTLTLLPAWDSMTTLQQLTAMLGPAIGSIGSTLAATVAVLDKSGKKDLGAADVSGAVGALGASLSSLSKANFRELAEALLAGVTVAGQKGDAEVLAVFDVHFRGRTFDAFHLLYRQIEWNYADFFAALKPMLARLAELQKAKAAAALTVKLAEPTASETTSPASGSAGGSSPNA